MPQRKTHTQTQLELERKPISILKALSCQLLPTKKKNPKPQTEKGREEEKFNSFYSSVIVNNNIEKKGFDLLTE